MNLSKLLRAFAAGGAGGAANVLTLIIIWQFILPGPPLTEEFLKGLLYRQVTWGGIWGFVFLIPIPFLNRNWWLRGIVWGAAATAVALFVFKVVPFSVTNVIIGLVVNSGSWGQVASWLYKKSGN